MKRRTNGEGSVSFVTSRNHWRAAVRISDHKGESKRHFFYGKTSEEALEKMRVAQKRIALGKPAKDAKLTVANWIGMRVQDVLPFSGGRRLTRFG